MPDICIVNIFSHSMDSDFRARGNPCLVQLISATFQLPFLQNNTFPRGKDCESALFTSEPPTQGLVHSRHKINIYGVKEIMGKPPIGVVLIA